jgi:hypothetical protein
MSCMSLQAWYIRFIGMRMNELAGFSEAARIAVALPADFNVNGDPCLLGAIVLSHNSILG